MDAQAPSVAKSNQTSHTLKSPNLNIMFSRVFYNEITMKSLEKSFKYLIELDVASTCMLPLSHSTSWMIL